MSDKPSEGERLNNALNGAGLLLASWQQRNPGEQAQLDIAAAAFAARYLARIEDLRDELAREAAASGELAQCLAIVKARITELEAENVALRAREVKT